MLLRKIRQLFLAVLFVLALACTANASMLEYSLNSLPIGDSDATIVFTIDTDQGDDDGDYSMHNGLLGDAAYDSVFTFSLEIDGTSYSDDIFSSDAYPLVTLNSDLTVNGIDFWAATSDGTLLVIENYNGSTILTAIANYLEIDLVTDIDNDGIDEDDILAAITDEVLYESDYPSAVIPSNSSNGWTTSEIPEPTTFSLFGLGLFGWAWVIRRRFLK